MSDVPREDAQWLDAVRVDDKLQIRVPLKVMPWTFMLGGTQDLLLEVDGEPKQLSIRVPAGTSPGQVLRLRGVTLGDGRADVFVELSGIKVQPQMIPLVAGVLGAIITALLVFILASSGSS
jgi:hypothetical protein